MDNLKIGAVLTIIAIFLVPASMETMAWWDEARMEHELECNPLLNNQPNMEYCNELSAEADYRMTIFGLTVLSFVLSGVIGLVNLLPVGDEGIRNPPGGRF